MIGQSYNQQVYVPLRPLNKGIDLETPPQLIEVGAFLDVSNCDVRRGGLRRRGGYVPFLSGLPSIDDRIYGSPIYYDPQGDPVVFLFAKKHLWRVDDTNVLTLMSKSLYTGLSGDVTVSVAGGQYYDVTVTGETFQTDDTINPGDVAWIGGTSSGVPYEIVDVSGETTFVVRDHDGTLSPSTGTTVDVVAGFRGAPDWTVLPANTGSSDPPYLVFTDNSSRGLMAYDGMTVDVYNSAQTPILSEVDTVTMLGYRLWMGGMTESGVNERNRVRWTTVANWTEFPVSQFLDLPRGRSGIVRLMPLGNLLVAYFRERIFFGRPTNIVNLPYDFTIYDTGNVGLVGKHAVVAWLDSHWFVGQDDIYVFSASRSLERIGTRVVRETVQNPDVDLSETIVSADPANERIVFQFFGRSSGTVRDLWAFYYKTGGWSREPFGGTGYYYGRTVDGTTFEEATGTWEATTWLASWTSFQPVASEEKTFILKGQSIYLRQDDASQDTYDSGTSPIEVVIESGDFDFGSPNVLKTVTQLSVKFEGDVSDDLEFRVDVSNNRTTTWKTVGRLRVRAGQDEGKVDFRTTGSLFRFRLTGESVSRRWTLNEIVLIATEVGREHVFV